MYLTDDLQISELGSVLRTESVDAVEELSEDLLLLQELNGDLRQRRPELPPASGGPAQLPDLAHTHTHTHAHDIHARTHARTYRAHAHIYTHKYTRAHTQTDTQTQIRFLFDLDSSEPPLSHLEL